MIFRGKNTPLSIGPVAGQGLPCVPMVPRLAPLRSTWPSSGLNPSVRDLDVFSTAPYLSPGKLLYNGQKNQFQEARGVPAFWRNVLEGRPSKDRE